MTYIRRPRGQGAVMPVFLIQAIVLLAGIAAAVLALPGVTPAAVRTPFEPPRFSTNDTGDISIVGNTLMTCPATAPNCPAARSNSASGAVLNNNSYDMQFVDVDENPTTFNSSRATFELPVRGEVLWAGLYWGARSPSAVRNQVVFATPASGGYQTVTGEVVGAFGNPSAYHAFAEVTNLVSEGGSGAYTVGNVQALLGRDRYAGWSLVVVYRDPSSPPRNLTVFDGFADVVDNPTNRVVDVPISGFTAPPDGAVNARLGAVVYEGDGGSTGDSLRFRGGSQQNFTTISDPSNPADNFFNSAISRDGQRISAKNPDYENQMGFDAVTIGANGIIPNGETSAVLRLTTGGETFYPGVVTTAVELYAPAVELQKTVRDINGGEAVPGDVLEYEIVATNAGQDFSDNTVLSDAIPQNTAFVPGSLQVTQGANVGPKTDGDGDDQAEVAAGPDRVVFRVGAGADAADGGRLGRAGQPNDSSTVRYRVTIQDSAEGTIVRNRAAVEYFGRVVGESFTGTSNATETPVPPYADLSLTKSDSADPVTVGDQLTYTLTVSNGGVSDATGVTVTDDLPDAVEFVSATPSSGTCSEVGGTVTCDLGDLAVNAQATVTIVAEATSGGVTSRNTASVGSNLEDPNPANNEASEATRIDLVQPLPSADLSVSKSGPASVAVGERFVYNLRVANAGPDEATGVRLEDRLPSGVNLVYAPDDCRVRAGLVRCDLGQIASGAARTLTFRVEATTRGNKTNSATVAGNRPDPSAANNLDNATTRVDPAPCADMAVKVKAPKRVTVGKNFAYTVTARNSGPLDVRNAVLTSRLPKNVKFVRAGQGCRYNRAAGDVVCGLGNVLDGALKQRKIVVKAEKAGTVRLRGCTVRSGTPDCNPSNNQLGGGSPGARSAGRDQSQAASGAGPETTVVAAPDGSS